MVLLLLSTPLSLLSFYLSFLAWRRRFRRQAMVLLLIALLLLGLSVTIGIVSTISYFSIQAHLPPAG